MFKGFQDIDFKNNSCAVYALHNTVSNKYYVGATQDLEKRLVGHLNTLKAGKHSNGELQKDFKKLGQRRFSIVVLKAFKNSSRNELLTTEEVFINSIGEVYNKTNVLANRPVKKPLLFSVILTNEEINKTKEFIIKGRKVLMACAFIDISPQKLIHASTGGKIKPSQHARLTEFLLLVENKAA